MDLAISALITILRVTLGLELYYATTRIIRMRSVPLYFAIQSVGLTADEIIRAIGDSRLGILQVFVGLWVHLLVPILLSQGDLRTRVSRVLLLLLAMILNEAVGTLAYTLMTGGQPMYANIAERDPIATVSVYLFLAVSWAILLEAIVAACARADRRRDPDAHVELPVIAAMAGAVMLFRFIYTVSSNAGVPAIMTPALLVYALLALALGVALLVASRREHQARLEEVRRDAELRQAEQLRRSIAAEVRRMGATRRLRHDLSNQVEVVRELAGRGELAEADRYLAQLQDQARAVAEGPCAAAPSCTGR